VNDKTATNEPANVWTFAHRHAEGLGLLALLGLWLGFWAVVIAVDALIK